MKNLRPRQCGCARILATFLGIPCALASAGAPEAPSNQPWARQLGTPEADVAQSVASDAMGNVYLGGVTLGSLGGPYAGLYDMFIAKFAHDGSPLWTRQIGTLYDESSISIAVDGENNLIIGGATGGNLAGMSAGLGDAYVAKYSPEGAMLWKRQFGSSGEEIVSELAVDRQGDVYIIGTTDGSLGGANAGLNDAFVAKFSSAGDLLWTRQFGTAANEIGSSVTIDDADNVLFAGKSDDLASITKCTSAGDVLWSRTLQSLRNVNNRAIGVDGAGNAFIAGFTLGGPQGHDVFIAKYSWRGDLVWTRQFGTIQDDRCFSTAVDAQGDIILAGFTFGNLAGASAGASDMFIAKYSSAGEQRWIRQFGTPATDACLGMALDVQGNAMIAGYTRGDLGGTNAGERDAYVAKFRAQPGDVNRDGSANVQDLLAVIASWGPCPASPIECPTDIAPLPAGDGTVNASDLVMVVADWS